MATTNSSVPPELLLDELELEPEELLELVLEELLELLEEVLEELLELLLDELLEELLELLLELELDEDPLLSVNISRANEYRLRFHTYMSCPPPG